MRVFIKVNAGNDTNGNPRCGWIEYARNDDGHISPVAFYDEGYDGDGALPKGVDTHDVSWNALQITPRQYRELRRMTLPETVIKPLDSAR